jgi:hypothetical protein
MGYPGSGLGSDGIVLGGFLGMTYSTAPVITMCKLFGTLETPAGAVPGTAGTALSNSASGSVILADTWNGVTVTASISVADASSGKIVTVDKITRTTNDKGYFELYVIQGLTVTVSCPSFGKSVVVPTTGLTSIDLSTFF